MERALAGDADFAKRSEMDWAFEFEEPAYLTIGLCYEQNVRVGRRGVRPYLPVLKRCEEFIDGPIRVAMKDREGRAATVLELDDHVAKCVDSLKKAGFVSPYLKAFVIARINPLRFVSFKVGVKGAQGVVRGDLRKDDPEGPRLRQLEDLRTGHHRYRRRPVRGLGSFPHVTNRRRRIDVVLRDSSGDCRAILAQPFDSQRTNASERSFIWLLHNDTIHRMGPAGDFLALYHAGMQVEAGFDPYEPTRVTPQIWAAAAPRLPYFSPYRYLPILAQTVGRAFAELPARTAYLAWVLFIESALFALCLLLVRLGPTPGLRWAAPCLLLLSSPYFLELHMGQFTFVTAVFYAVALLLCARETPGVAAVGVAIASFTLSVLLKIIPLVGIPALIRRRAGFWASVSGVVAILVLTVPVFAVHPNKPGSS